MHPCVKHTRYMGISNRMFCAATGGTKDNRLCNHLKVLPLHDNVSFPSLREPFRRASLPPREHS